MLDTGQIIFIRGWSDALAVSLADIFIQTEFHAGNLLSHTIFTFLYVHHLPDIEPDLLPSTSEHDPLCPRELVTLVLRSAVQGLLKSCDLSWRELSKGGMQDVSFFRVRLGGF